MSDEENKEAALPEGRAEVKSITFEKNKLYLVLESAGDGFNFEIYDRLEETPENTLVSCLLRGMISIALDQTDAVVQHGMRAFQRDFGMELTEDSPVAGTA